MALLVALTFVCAAVSLTGAIEYCGLLHENAECVSRCGAGNEVKTEPYLCPAREMCCKPLLTTLAPETLNIDSNTCGVSTFGRVKRSITGIPSSKCNWPWLVSIRMENENASIEVSHVMTGVLVSKTSVLVYWETFMFFESRVTKIEAVVGDYYLNMNGDENAIYTVDLSTKKVVGEFVLLELGEEVQVGDCVRPICLADTTEARSLDMSQCKLIGWGQTETGTGRLTLAPIPLQESVTFLHRATCVTLLKYIHHKPSGQLLCLDSNPHPSLPQHDVGNPIICPNEVGQWHLMGILAQGNYDFDERRATSAAIAVDVVSSVGHIRMNT